MVDPLGTASGVLALTIFAFNATVSLYQALNSFQNITKAIIDLKKELQDLEKVLTFLQQALSNNLDELLLLESVLSRCGQKCENFQTLVAECTQNSSASRTSLRDWAKLKFKQNEITELRDVLSRDKLTISVAVCGINLYG
jgi:chromosome segregation ATPase